MDPEVVLSGKLFTPKPLYMFPKMLWIVYGIYTPLCFDFSSYAEQMMGSSSDAEPAPSKVHLILSDQN